jgi:ribonuclease D
MADDAPDASVDEVELTPLLAPRVADVRLVDSAEELRAGIQDLHNGSGPLAVDAERASGFKYSQRAYLIQLHRQGAPILLVDPIAVLIDDPSAFGNAQIELEQYVWIIHAATQDIPCLSELGLRPKRLFDTELAGRLANFERVGLGAMVARTLGFQLAKEHSAVDWSTRPLQASWLNYAALDVDVLPELMDALIQELEKQGKLPWAEEEFEHLTRFTPKPSKEDRWRGISGLHTFKQTRDLAVARELWNARETLAQKLDVSPGRLIPDSSIVEVVQSKPRSKAELSANKKFSGRASRSYLDLWWESYSRGSSTSDLPLAKIPSTGIPNHRVWANKFPEADARLVAAKQAITELVELHGIPAENLLSPDFLRQLCWSTEDKNSDEVAEFLRNLGARSWQTTLVSPALAEVLSPLWRLPNQE